MFAIANYCTYFVVLSDPANTNTVIRTRSDSGVARNQLCYFPFLFNGVSYNMCIPNTQMDFWCGTVYNFDASTEAFGFCPAGLNTFYFLPQNVP